jgi:hypothetical protein
MTEEILAELGTNVGNVAGFQSAMQGEGLSARAGLRAFRGAGGAIRDQRWFNSWGEVSASRAGMVSVGSVPLSSIPSADNYATWSAGRPGQFATQVRVLVRNAGEDTYETRQFTHVTTGPHTGQEAIDAAIDTYSQTPGEGTPQGMAQGAYVSGYYKMVGASNG